jgi:hypothetical protein
VAGGNFDGTVLGGAGGGQNKTIANGSLPANIPYTDPGHTHGFATSGFTAAANGVSSGGINVWAPAGGSGTTQSANTGITINQGGANAPLPIIPNAMTLPLILRVI